jgi:hypothetical protein
MRVLRYAQDFGSKALKKFEVSLLPTLPPSVVPYRYHTALQKPRLTPMLVFTLARRTRALL